MHTWNDSLLGSLPARCGIPEVGSTRVEPVERAATLKLEGQCRYRRVDDVKHWAGRAGRAGGWAILQNRRRKGTIAGPTKARDCLTDKEAVGREEAGGRPEEVSVGLVRRRETPRRLEDQRRTDIWGISKAVVGRAVLSDFDIGRCGTKADYLL
ncbi:hypothetical protein BY996DRAFT_6577504 [Phakopsora pachyrhizi]|nr:hypothetical protein BY996DRAFT_6577504 [Phakopsora pachyrhizi]